MSRGFNRRLNRCTGVHKNPPHRINSKRKFFFFSPQVLEVYRLGSSATIMLVLQQNQRKPHLNFITPRVFVQIDQVIFSVLYSLFPTPTPGKKQKKKRHLELVPFIICVIYEREKEPVFTVGFYEMTRNYSRESFGCHRQFHCPQTSSLSNTSTSSSPPFICLFAHYQDYPGPVGMLFVVLLP